MPCFSIPALNAGCLPKHRPLPWVLMISGPGPQPVLMATPVIEEEKGTFFFSLSQNHQSARDRERKTKEIDRQPLPTCQPAPRPSNPLAARPAPHLPPSLRTPPPSFTFPTHKEGEIERKKNRKRPAGGKKRDIYPHFDWDPDPRAPFPAKCCSTARQNKRRRPAGSELDLHGNLRAGPGRGT